MLIAKATLRPDRPGQPAGSAVLSDLSYLGVGFHTRTPLQVGGRYQLKLEVGPMKWSNRLRVVSCTPQENGTFGVGAEFVGNELSLQKEAA